MNQSVIQRAREQSEMTETLQLRDTFREDEVTQIATDLKYLDMISSSSRDKTCMETLTDIESTTAKGEKRKSLQHMLQPVANDNETLVGANSIFKPVQSKRIKTKSIIEAKIYTPMCEEVTKDETSLIVQEEKIEITIEDLISPVDSAKPGKNYWQFLAGKLQTVLADTLDENKRLQQCFEKLEKEISIYKEMLIEAKTILEILRENKNEGNDTNVYIDLDTLMDYIDLD